MSRHCIAPRNAQRVSRIIAYDRRLSAIHEAGHAIIALYWGLDVDAWIHENPTHDPLTEKTWLGHVTVRDLPDEGHPVCRSIAVAGMVAERLWKHGHDEEYAEPYSWEDSLFDEFSMSFSDWRLTGCEPGEPDDDLHQMTAAVAKLFMDGLWPTLTDLSRTLMRGSGQAYTFTNAAARTA